MLFPVFFSAIFLVVSLKIWLLVDCSSVLNPLKVKHAREVTTEITEGVFCKYIVSFL